MVQPHKQSPQETGLSQHISAHSQVVIGEMLVQVPQHWVALIGGVNVQAVAVHFGGGGHVLASGCELSGDGDEIREKVLERIRQELQATDL